MISAKKLLKLARKWQKQAAMRRKGIVLPQTIASTDTSSCRASIKAEKGHFAVYSSDQKQFLLPLGYLNNELVRQLLNMVEEEFGLFRNRPLTLPCETELMECAIKLKLQVNKDIERTLLTSIASNCCSLSFHIHHQATTPHLSICSF